jgi:soluble cytochrome b562
MTETRLKTAKNQIEIADYEHGFSCLIGRQIDRDQHASRRLDARFE